ncbi:MAG: septum formation initiator family protein [Bacteroidetes bacterium]|nr:septum formation initiator family protein [Bacteroidota bacterium]
MRLKILTVRLYKFEAVKLFKLLRNKYGLAVIGVMVWLLFFDKNDVMTQYELAQKCRKLKHEKQYYLAEIENNKKNLVELRSNTKSLEILAREKYLMKKDNEDVFVFVTK